MALFMYFDSACTNAVSELNPDTVRQAAQSGEDIITVAELWIKSDNLSLTYENITMTAIGDNNTPSSGDVDIKYSLDGVTYSDQISIPNTDFATALKIWRKVTAPNVTFAFNKTDILHQIKADEYAK